MLAWQSILYIYIGWPRRIDICTLFIIQLDNVCAAQRWAREKEAKIGAGVWMWWTDGSRLDDGLVGAAAVCKHRSHWMACGSCMGTGRMEVFDA